MSNNSVLGMKSHFSVPNKYLIIAGGGISYPKKSSQIISLISFLSEMVIQFSWFCGRFEVSCLLLTGSLYVMKQKMILQCVTHHVQHEHQDMAGCKWILKTQLFQMACLNLSDCIPPCFPGFTGSSYASAGPWLLCLSHYSSL